LEKYILSSPEMGERVDLEPLCEITKSTEEFEVISIVAEKKIKKCSKYIKMYQCDWKGYGITEEWIPASNLRNAPELLKEWESKKNSKENSKKK
jgi:hypothetical protein